MSAITLISAVAAGLQAASAGGVFGYTVTYGVDENGQYYNSSDADTAQLIIFVLLAVVALIALIAVKKAINYLRGRNGWAFFVTLWILGLILNLMPTVLAGASLGFRQGSAWSGLLVSGYLALVVIGYAFAGYLLFNPLTRQYFSKQARFIREQGRRAAFA